MKRFVIKCLQGFGITGKVEISGRDGGAKGVNVELKSDNNQDIRTTMSDASGIFYFTPVIPGKYRIKVNRDTYVLIGDVINIELTITSF